jgi:hypothetical protein
MNKRGLRFRFDVGTVLPRAMLAFALAVVTLPVQAQITLLPVLPEVRSHDHVASLTLHAVRGNDGRDSFAFNGQTTAPIIRVSPGDTLKITYVNDLPQPSGEQCSVGPCMNMTNLHFHGLGVSPKAPADDVLGMIAMPGQTLNYVVYIPPNQEPGLYWYHTHPHGESEQQVLDGMSGAIIVEGMERYAPVVRGLPERILILRGPPIGKDTNGQAAVKKVEAAVIGCGNSEAPERVFTINGELRPTINIAPGERQFWRIVNASADRYADVELERGSVQPWSFGSGQSAKRVVPTGIFRTSDIEQMRMGVLEHLGFAQAPAWLFAAELREGSVVRLLTAFERTVPIVAVRPASRRLSTKVRIFIEHLEKTFALCSQFNPRPS